MHQTHSCLPPHTTLQIDLRSGEELQEDAATGPSLLWAKAGLETYKRTWSGKVNISEGKVMRCAGDHLRQGAGHACAAQVDSEWCWVAPSFACLHTGFIGDDLRAT